MASRVTPGLSAARQACDVLLAVLWQRRPELRDRALDVARLALAVGRAMRMSESALGDLVLAAHLHDIGKIAIPETTLQKPEPLSSSEWEAILRHTVVGEAILASAPALRGAAVLVRASHERWDGRGYPDGLTGVEIPLGGRIIFVCGAYDAMTSERPYGPRLSHLDAVEELRRHAGTQFDPAVVGALVDAFHPAPAPFPSPEERDTGAQVLVA